MKLLGIEEVAENVGLSKWAVYQAIEAGELRASKMRSKWRIRPEDVEAWFEANVNVKGQPRKRRTTVPGYLTPIKGGQG